MNMQYLCMGNSTCNIDHEGVFAGECHYPNGTHAAYVRTLAFEYDGFQIAKYQILCLHTSSSQRWVESAFVVADNIGRQTVFRSLDAVWEFLEAPYAIAV